MRVRTDLQGGVFGVLPRKGGSGPRAGQLLQQVQDQPNHASASEGLRGGSRQEVGKASVRRNASRGPPNKAV